MPSPSIAEGQQRRDDIVAFLRTFSAEKGYAPSFSEIGAGIGGLSDESVRRHMRILVKEGRIWMGPYPRMITVLQKD